MCEATTGWHDVAAKEGFHACTGWSVDDVMDKAKAIGKAITEEQALDILLSNQNRIIDHMVSNGWDAIECAIDFAELPDADEKDEEDEEDD